jgi:hypothetical protein
MAQEFDLLEPKTHHKSYDVSYRVWVKLRDGYLLQKTVNKVMGAGYIFQDELLCHIDDTLYCLRLQLLKVGQDHLVQYEDCLFEIVPNDRCKLLEKVMVLWRSKNCEKKSRDYLGVGLVGLGNEPLQVAYPL